MKKTYLTVSIMVVMLLLGLSVNSYRLAKRNIDLEFQLEAFKNDPQIFAKDEIKQLTLQLSRLVVVPTDEDPVVATVTDKEKLANQPVFSKAENGDKIVIYAKAEKAYVYRPSLGVLVDVIPVNIGGQKTAISGVDAQNPLTLALVNGKKIAGMAVELEKRIEEMNIAGVSVVSKTTAKKNDYARTLVIDVGGKHKEQTLEIASLLSGDVADLGSVEEDIPNADILVIIGENFR